MTRDAVDDGRLLERGTLVMLMATCMLLAPLASPRRTTPSLAQLSIESLPGTTASGTTGTLAPKAAFFELPASTASRQVREVVGGILVSHDNGNVPFLVVDKRNAHLYVIAADGHLVGHSPVLLGAARGDDSVPGIGERPMAAIRPFERTTPAGRFEAAAGKNAQGEEVVWVDYDAAISMHRVRATNPRERRLQRLATPTSSDNRISYGCINVPVAFFNTFVGPLFRSGPHAVYVLPEVKTSHDVFGPRLERRSG